MNIVDSSGWLEYFAEGPNAGKFAEPLAEVSRLAVPAITLYEVLRIVFRQRGEDAALQAVALMQQGEVVELGASLSLHAARISLELKLPMADSIILATARSCRAVLWTQEEDFAGLEGVRYFPKG